MKRKLTEKQRKGETHPAEKQPSFHTNPEGLSVSFINSFALHQVAVEAGVQGNDRLIPVAPTGPFVPFLTGNR